MTYQSSGIQNVGAVGAISAIFMKDVCIQVLSIHVDTKIPENNVNIIVFPIITINLYSCL